MPQRRSGPSTTLPTSRTRTGTQVALAARTMFFFSSRRRHTRLTCDWSSDVCSSDLASKFAVEQLLLPVRNVLEGVADDEFYAPGSIFRLELDTSDPLARDMPAQSVAWYESGPAFEVLDSSAARVVGRYPTDPDRVLLSGWALHPER